MAWWVIFLYFCIFGFSVIPRIIYGNLMKARELYENVGGNISLPELVVAVNLL